MGGKEKEGGRGRKGRKGEGREERRGGRRKEGKGKVASWLLEGWTPLGSPPSQLEINICLRLRPRFPPGLCPWTPLGTSVPQTPTFVPRSKFLATPLLSFMLLQYFMQFTIYNIFEANYAEQ